MACCPPESYPRNTMWLGPVRGAWFLAKYLYHTILIPYLGAPVPALPLLAAPKWRIREAGRFLHCFEAVRVYPPSMRHA